MIAMVTKSIIITMIMVTMMKAGALVELLSTFKNPPYTRTVRSLVSKSAEVRGNIDGLPTKSVFEIGIATSRNVVWVT